MRSYAGNQIGTEVELLGPAPGGRSFCRTKGGDAAFSVDDCALRVADSEWEECRIVEAKLRTMLAGLAGGSVDPRRKIAERAVHYAKREGLQTWSDSGMTRDQSAFSSLETILRERSHLTGDGTVHVTGVNKPWVVTLWLGVLNEWEKDREMFADPGERHLQLAPPIEDEDLPLEVEEEETWGAREVFARLDDVRLSVRMMEAWCDNDEEEFLQCLAILERQGR